MSVLGQFMNNRVAQLSARLNDAYYEQTSTNAVTLEQLFTKAEEYGHVHIYSSDMDEQPNSYRAKIVLVIKTNVELEACSDFGLSLKTALQQAIEKAEKVKEEFSE